MMAMYERLKAKEAEFAYNAAKGRILKKFVGIKIVKYRSALYEIEKGKLQNGTYQTLNSRPWKRSTNTCGRCWRKRIWTFHIPTNCGGRRHPASAAA
jgi:hypothetical protein